MLSLTGAMGSAGGTAELPGRCPLTAAVPAAALCSTAWSSCSEGRLIMFMMSAASALDMPRETRSWAIDSWLPESLDEKAP